jgi:ferritin-like metal-binding protein YciE
MPAKDLNALFLDTLKDIYYAEKQIYKSLPKMAKAAASEQLRAAFEKHHDETEEQIERHFSANPRAARNAMRSRVSWTRVRKS